MRMRGLIDHILNTGRLSYGPLCQEFEQRFSALHGCGYGVLSNSGTSSLLVALQTLKEIHGWDDGDEVIVPAVTFVATVNVVIHCNLKPVLVDIDPRYYAIDPELISSAITTRTRAIIPVHPFGQPADMTEIMEIARMHDLKVIEDSCEAMGVTHSGRPVGSMGDIGCFSMYVAHILTTGVGGIAITGNTTYARKMRSLVNHGWDRQTRPVDVKEYDLEEIRSRYYFTSVGHSFRITELEAAIGVAQLDDLPRIIDNRQFNAAHLTHGLARLNLPLGLPRTRPTNGHSWMMYPILWTEGNKWDIIAHLEANGIETREMLPLTNQPVYGSWCNEDDYPVAKMVNECGLYIGCHQYLTRADLDRVVEVFASYDTHR